MQRNQIAFAETGESNSKILVAGSSGEISILNRQRKSTFVEIKSRGGDAIRGINI